MDSNFILKSFQDLKNYLEIIEKKFIYQKLVRNNDETKRIRSKIASSPIMHSNFLLALIKYF